MEEIKKEETIVNTQAAIETPTTNVVEEKQTNKKEAPKAPQRRKPNPNQNKKPKAKLPTEMSGDGWVNDLKKAFNTNEKIQKDRLNPHYKLNLNTNAKMRITPLGGLGEIGGNMMIIETEKSAIIVDVGMNFPDDDEFYV